MSFFDTFMFFTLLKELFEPIYELATDPETAKWFWGISGVIIAVLSIALLIVSNL